MSKKANQKSVKENVPLYVEKGTAQEEQFVQPQGAAENRKKNKKKQRRGKKDNGNQKIFQISLEQQTIVKKIEDYVNTYKPKHLKPKEILAEKAIPFWTKNVVQNLELDQKKFLPGNEQKTQERKTFIKKGAAMISGTHKGITWRKMAPLHRVTPIPTNENCLLMALRAARAKHYGFWKNDLINMKNIAKKEKVNFENFFDINEEKINEDLFRKEKTATGLKAYAQVFNCRIVLHRGCFPDPKPMIAKPAWQVKQRTYVDREGKQREKKPWICHILVTDNHASSIKITNLKESMKISDDLYSQKEYFVPIDYRQEDERWMKEYEEYLRQLDTALNLYDQNKSLTEETVMQLKQLQPLVYHKKTERKQTQERIKQIEEDLRKCGLKVRVDNFAGYKQLQQFNKQVQADKRNQQKHNPNVEYECKIKAPSQVRINKTQRSKARMEEELIKIKKQLDEAIQKIEMQDIQLKEYQKNRIDNQADDIELEKKASSPQKKLKKDNQKDMQIRSAEKSDIYYTPLPTPQVQQIIQKQQYMMEQENQGLVQKREQGQW